LQVDYQKYTLELTKLGWIVEIHDGKSNKYAATRLGMDSLETYRQYCQKSNSFSCSSDQFRWLIKNGILVRYFDSKTNAENVSATPYGFGLFYTMEYWLNAKLQQRQERRKKIEQFVISAKKGMDLFIKYANSGKSKSKSTSFYGGS